MATRKLYAIANFLGAQVTLSNVEEPGDLAKIDPNAVTRTGGKDGDYCLIPQCSGSEYFAEHHMSVEADTEKGQFNMALWFNDAEEDQRLYYSLNGQYSGRVPVEGSNTWEGGATFLIQGQKDVRFFPY
jgi:hypothetical protein